MIKFRFYLVGLSPWAVTCQSISWPFFFLPSVKQEGWDCLSSAKSDKAPVEQFLLSTSLCYRQQNAPGVFQNGDLFPSPYQKHKRIFLQSFL